MKKTQTILIILIIILINTGCSNDDSTQTNSEELVSCEGDVILKSQEEIISFARNGCQKIIGSLTIDDI